MTTTEQFAAPAVPAKAPRSMESKEDQAAGIKRDRYGRYLIPDPDTGKERAWTRATTHAKTISDTFMIHAWQNRMVAKGLAMRPDLLAMVSVTDDRSELDELCAQAQSAAGSKIGSNLGTAVHSLTEQADMGVEIRSMPPSLAPSVQTYRDALAASYMEAIPEYTEAVIICPPLGVAGRLDRILRNTAPVGRWTDPDVSYSFIGDVKTAKNIGYSWLEVSIQLAIYAHASHVWNPKTKELTPFPKVDQFEAVVMHVPVPDPTHPAETQLYRINIDAGWEYANLADLVRKARKDKSLAVRLGETISAKLDPAPSSAGQDQIPQELDYRTRMRQATCRADLSQIWREADARGQWTPELEAYGKQIAIDLRG